MSSQTSYVSGVNVSDSLSTLERKLWVPVIAIMLAGSLVVALEVSFLNYFERG